MGVGYPLGDMDRDMADIRKMGRPFLTMKQKSRPELSYAHAVFAWGNPYHSAKHFAEVTLIDKAGASAGLKHRKVRFAKKLPGPVNATAKHVLVRSNPVRRS